MKKTPSYLTTKFGSPVIGGSMILYKAIFQGPKGNLFSQRERWHVPFPYKLGVIAKPVKAPAPATYGVCESGIHVGSMRFAKDWARYLNSSRPLDAKIVILACQVNISDMIVDGHDGKVRCKKVLPLGIVRE